MSGSPQCLLKINKFLSSPHTDDVTVSVSSLVNATEEVVK